MTRHAARLFAFFIFVVLVAAGPSAAQTPAAGQNAAGVDIGVFIPHEAFEKAFTVDGFGEHYFTRRVSVRGMLAWANPGVTNRTEDHFRQTKLLFKIGRAHV